MLLSSKSLQLVVLQWRDLMSTLKWVYKVETFDPVFVNPSSFDSVKEVLWRVGHAASVSRYHPDVPNTRKWLSVIMDHSPYLVSKTVIDTVYLSNIRSFIYSFTQFTFVVIVKQKFWNQNRWPPYWSASRSQVNFIMEFDWMLWHNGKLHLEMIMAKTFTSHNWKVFMCELTKELGFTSEAAYKYVKKCSQIIIKPCPSWKWPILVSGMSYFYLTSVIVFLLDLACQWTTSCMTGSDKWDGIILTTSTSSTQPGRIWWAFNCFTLVWGETMLNTSGQSIWPLTTVLQCFKKCFDLFAWQVSIPFLELFGL